MMKRSLRPRPVWPALALAASLSGCGGASDAQAIRAFAVARRGHGPEQLCDQGARP